MLSGDELESSLFEETIDTFDLFKSEMLKNIVKCIVLDVQSRSQAYRKDRYLSLYSAGLIDSCHL